MYFNSYVLDFEENMIKPVKFLQPTIYMTEKARTVMKHKHDDAVLHLGLSALQEMALPKEAIKPGFWQNLFNVKRNTTKLSYIIDVDKNKNFTLAAQRRVNKFVFKGQSVNIDFYKMAFSKEAVLNAILEAKKSVLVRLSALQDYLRS